MWDKPGQSDRRDTGITEAVSVVIAAAISAVVSVAVAFAVNIQGHEQFFSTTVSTERMNWIKDMRRLCEDLCAVCEQYGPGELPPDQYAVFLRAKNGILLRLDPPGWYPQTGDRIVALLSDPDYAKIRENIPEIRDIAQRILKSEWDSVKCEAGNSLRKIRAIESMKKEIEGKYRTRV